ncbi:hypothetical protein QFZ74_000018 [Streptomyces sp. V3I7]|nr:hypothetical protein [Streptomyces sp. V3I7]
MTAIWSNPPKKAKTRSVRVTLDGDQLGSAQTARRVGKTISYRWSAFDTGTDTKVCVKFAGINRVACETTRYIGNRQQF